MNAGWIYALTNRSLPPDWLKIGRTESTPSDRASQLSSATGVAAPFDVAYCEPVPDCVRAETLIHQRLAERRVSTNREFFSIGLSEAQGVIHEICELVRDESPLCQQCPARSRLIAAQSTIEKQDEDIGRLRAAARRQEQKSKRIQERYRKFRRRVRHLVFAAFLRRVRNVIGHFCNLISYIRSGIAGLGSKAIPNAEDRRLIIWSVLAPVGLGGWIALLILRWDIAIGVVFTFVLIAALAVIWNAPRELRDRQDGSVEGGSS